MNWAYFAGYFDGEGSLVFSVTKEKRERFLKNSLNDGWGINPLLTISSYDYETLKEIQDFLDSFDRKVNKHQASYYDVKKARDSQTRDCGRLIICGWKRVDWVAKNLIPYSINKKQQLVIYRSLVRHIIAPAPEYKIKRKPTKKHFLCIMEYVDKINSLKSRNRGKYNTQYFRDLWGMN